MNADCKGALAQLNTSYKAFEHKGKKMSKAQVKAVLEYAIEKGYEHTGMLGDEEVDRILEQLKHNKVSGKAVVFKGSSKWQSAIKTLTVGKTYHVIDDNGVSFKIRNDKGLIKRYFRHYFKEEPMNTNPTQLPQEVQNEISALADKHTANLRTDTDFHTGYSRGVQEGIEIGAITYATDRHQLQQENAKLKEQAEGWRPLLEKVLHRHEGGLLPDRLLYLEIKKFLYGE